MRTASFLLVAAALVAPAVAECPNACSGNGECGTYDACTCYDGFTGGDCSQSMCQYGIAFVDVPAGDLNHDGMVGTTTTPANWAVAYSQVQYNSYKQAEYWPTLAGYTSGGAFYKADNTGIDPTLLQGGGWAASGDEAHFYAECSGRGICDRTAGACSCFNGFTGAACQRTSCPNDCSNHGVCYTVSEIASTKATKRLLDSAGGVSTYSGPQDYFVYRLWDSDKNRACSCDPGYSGIDCSLRECPRGDDPLTTSPTTCGGSTCTNEIQAFIIGGNQASSVAGLPVNYRITFYDYNGFAYTTKDWAIDTYLNYGAAANAAALATVQAAIASAIEALPNNITGDVTVTVSGDGTASTDNNLRVLVAFNTLSGNVPDMNVIPGATTAANSAGTPAVAQPFNRIQVLSLANVAHPWTISATVYPLNSTNIRKDASLSTDDTTSAAGVTVAATTLVGITNAVIAALQAIPAIAYYGTSSVSAVGSGTAAAATITVVLPNANFGANPISLRILNGVTDVTSTSLTGVVQLTTEGNTEYSVCSNRGVCDYSVGQCTCFTGYYGNACDTQSVLAM